MRCKKDLVLLWAAAVVSLLVCAGGWSDAQTIGMAASHGFGRVYVFNADTDTVIGSAPLPGALKSADCAVTADGTTGFATDFQSRVWVIDLTVSPPALASGVNPIPISNRGEDVSITPDGKYVVASDGALIQPISVIDIATRTQISTFSFGSDHNSVDVCSNGSVLATSYNTGRADRGTIDAAGTITNTGESLVRLPYPNNVTGAPDGNSGVVILREGRTMISFLTSGMTAVDSRLVPGDYGLATAFNPAGNRLFVNCSTVFSAWAYNAATGGIGASPLYSFPIVSSIGFFGMDQVAVHPGGAKVYVSQGDRVTVHDTSTGALLSTLVTGSRMTGVAVMPRAANSPPVITCTSPVVLWSVDHELADVSSAFTVSDPDNDPVTVTVRMISDESEVPEIRSGSGKFAPDFKDERAGRGLLARSERNGSGDGRYYILAITADDGEGGVVETACVAAVVPHDQTTTSLNLVLQEAQTTAAAIQIALDTDQPLPIANTYEHGLAAPAGPKQ